MFPGCSSLSCLISSCPASAEPQHFCESVLGRGVISQPGYPRQLSSNYITFSRRSPCHPAQHFSRPECPLGWTRHQYQCLLPVNTAQSYNHTGKVQAGGWIVKELKHKNLCISGRLRPFNSFSPVEECQALGGRLAYAVTARQRENYLELLEANTTVTTVTAVWVLKLRSVNITQGQCPALVAGQSELRTALSYYHNILSC